MLAQMIMLCLQATEAAAPVASVLGDVVVTETSVGDCTHSASYRISWSVANPDDDMYEVRLYEGTSLGEFLWAILPPSTTFYDNIISSQMVNGPYGRWTAEFTYTVELRRKSDGRLIARKTSATWRRTYGVCTPTPTDTPPGGVGGAGGGIAAPVIIV